MRILLILAFIASTILPSYGWGVHPVVAPIVPAISHPGPAAGASTGSAGAAAVAGFIGVVATLIVANEIKRKRCNLRHDTWVDTRHDWHPVYAPWRDLCRDPQAAPAKLWRDGK